MYVLLRYDGASGVLSLDRSRLYYPVLALPGQEAHDVAAVQLEKGLSSLRLDILLDTCSIEVFAQDGAAALTSLAFPKEGSADIRFAGEYSVKDLKFHTLKRVAE